MAGATFVISKVLWVISLASAGMGALNFFLTYGTELLFRSTPDISAPQLAALAGSSLAFAAIPYVLARGWDELTKPRAK